MALNSQKLSDVQTYVKRQFGDESAIQITDADITRFTNQACMEIVSKNKVLKASAMVGSIIGQAKYSKPDNSLQITSITYDGILLNNVGFDEFQKIFNSGEKIDSVTSWTQYGDTLIIGSTPQQQSKEIEVFYIPEPARVSIPTDVLPIPDRYYPRICEYVMSKVYELDEDWQAHQVNRQMFEDKMTETTNAENETSGPFPSVIPYEL